MSDTRKKRLHVPYQERKDVVAAKGVVEQLPWNNKMVSALPTSTSLNRIQSTIFKDTIEKKVNLKLLDFITSVFENHMPDEWFPNPAEKRDLGQDFGYIFIVYREHFQGEKAFSSSER